MEISIPDDQYKKLSQRAVAAGYSDVPALIEALAEEPLDDPRGRLTEEKLRQSAAELAAAETSIEAGQGIDAELAMQQIAHKHGLNLRG